MKNIQITAQYIALERTDNGAIDAHFSVYPEIEYKKTTVNIIRKEKIIQISTVWEMWHKN